MSAVLLSGTGPHGNNGSVQGTTVGGVKPLHRFIRGQPKIIGTVMLTLGVCFFIITIAITLDSRNTYHIWHAIPPGFLMGTMYIISGILYIVTEHNPTKKTVTISLALSIVSLLASIWTILHILPELGHYRYDRHYDMTYDENGTAIENVSKWSYYHESMGISMEAIFVFHTAVAIVIFIVMSTLAGAALRSTKSQAIVVMTATPTEAPAE